MASMASKQALTNMLSTQESVEKMGHVAGVIPGYAGHQAGASMLIGQPISMGSANLVRLASRH